ncbi:hypothetical protein OPV22_004062 [Ensete ventricosum]|uniref:Uncharacterized protein n=1 Tax=Ensete ventricosum TaxID=4639 RepID=A0AAV8S2I3_ENSVE|nr:hypothetical protein OPV22_004062 [Ensete ventricosum]
MEEEGNQRSQVVLCCPIQREEDGLGGGYIAAVDSAAGDPGPCLLPTRPEQGQDGGDAHVLRTACATHGRRTTSQVSLADAKRRCDQGGAG